MPKTAPVSAALFQGASRGRGTAAWSAALIAAGLAAGAALVSCGGPQTPEPVPGPTPGPVAAVTPACEGGAGSCDNLAANGCETDLTHSDANCGACGHACSSGERCLASTCRRQRTIAMFGRTTCAIHSDHVECWGYDMFQTGAPLARPVTVPALAGAVHLSLGQGEVCAVISSGRVVCWTNGAVEELPGIDDAVDVEVGTSQVHVVRKNGEVKAFENHLEVSLSPVQVRDVVAVTTGLMHTCALHGSGEVTCWGLLPYLGAGAGTEDLDEDKQKALEENGVKVKGLKDAIQIASAYSATCALRKTGKVACWGNVGRSENDVENEPAPVAVAGLDDAVELVLNEGDINHTRGCAVRASGKLACWGDDAIGSGQPAREGLTEVQDIGDAVAVAAGAETTCALRRSGAAACWGSADQGALGNGLVANPPLPQPVPGVSGAVALGLGEDYSCALDGAGQIVCWGDPAAYTTPGKRGIPVRVISTGAGYKSLFAATSHICAIDGKGAAACFDPTGVKAKESLSGLGRVKALYRGDPVGVALAESGQVFLFHNDGVSKQPITGLSDVVSVAPARAYSDKACAVRKSGEVACFSYSSRLFATPAKGRTAPAVTEVQGITDATTIVFGGPDFCVLHKAGDVTCFSAGDLKLPAAGAAASALFTPRLSRTADVRGTQLVGLRSGLCASRADGTVVCWGVNEGGVLGVGDDNPRKSPTVVSALSEVATLAAFANSYGHTCAAKKSGAVLCWGANRADQLGQEAPSISLTPVTVLPPAPR